jgi:hypothetical protein
MSNKETHTPIQMQWKKDKSDIHNKTVKNLEPVLARDSLSQNKNHADINRNEKSLSYNIDQEIHVKEVVELRHIELQVDKTNPPL